MELDDLKAGWRRSAERIQTPPRDIHSIITNEQGGPVSELRNRFRRGIIIVPVAVAIALSRLPRHHGLAFTMCFAFLMVFAVSMVVYFYYNYRLLGRVQAMDVTVKDNLLKEVKILEKGVRLRLIFMRTMALLFITIIESLLYWGKELTDWNTTPLLGRIIVYGAAFGAFYLLTHLAVKHRYSSKINHLKELVNEMD